MRPHHSLKFLVVLALTALLSCDDRTQPDAATDAQLQVKGGQFFRGDMPADASGPPVKTVAVSPIVHPGSVARTCSGVMDPSATAFALAIEGDSGFWIVKGCLGLTVGQTLKTWTVTETIVGICGLGMTLLAEQVLRVLG